MKKTMKNVVKRVVSVMIVCTLILSMTACGKSGDTKTPGTANKGNDEHVVITYMVTGDVPTNKTMTEALPALNKILTEKVNAELEVKWIEWTDYLSHYNLELASQDGNIDLVGTGTDWLDAWPNAQRDAFLPLTEEMLKENAPQTYAQVPAEHWDFCKYNGNIYFIPEDNFSQWTNYGFMYRGDWAGEAGLTDGVHSWDDLGKYFAYVKANKEGVLPWNATPDVVVINQMSNGWITSHTENIYIEGLRADLFFGESKDNPYTLSRYFLEGDELVKFAQNEKAWADAGYWKEDVLNNTSVDSREEFLQGLSAADQRHSMTFYDHEAKRMEQEYQPGCDLGFFWFGEEKGNLVSLNITHGAMAVAAKSKNPERALQVYDLLRNDPECYALFNYGFEGEQYILSEDGKTFTRPEGFVEDTDAVNFNFWWGRNDDLEFISPLTDVEKRDALIEQYNKVAIVYPYGKAVINLDPISAELDNLSNIYNTYMPQIVFGKAEDPAAYVAEFREQLKAAGYEKCIAEIESQLKAVYK